MIRAIRIFPSMTIFSSVISSKRNYRDTHIPDQKLFDQERFVNKQHYLTLCKVANHKNKYHIKGKIKKETLKTQISQGYMISFFNHYSEKERNQQISFYYHYTRCFINNNLLTLIAIHNLSQERDDYKQRINQSLKIFS